MQACTPIFVFVLSFLATSALSRPNTPADTVIIYRHCPPTSGMLTSYKPIVRVDTIMATDSARYDTPPLPLAGLSGLQSLIKYPTLAIKAGLECRVTAKLTINAEGLPSNIHVVRSDAPIFNDSVTVALARTIFTPARFRGDPLDLNVLVKVTFKLARNLEVSERQPLDVSEISLTKHPAMGGGPQYTIVLRKDLSSTYTGRADVEMLGTFQGTCNSSDFQRLERLLSWFCLLDPVAEARSMWTDVPFDDITLTTNGRQERFVTDGGDERLWAIARIVESISRRIKWEKVQ